MPGMSQDEGGAYQRVEVITGRQRRRRWTAEEKARIVSESLEADANISDVARRHGVARGLLTIWRRQLSSGTGGHEPGQSFAAVKIDTVAPLSNERRALFGGTGCGGGGIAGSPEPRADRDRCCRGPDQD